LQAACDELRRLQSITTTGLTYIQYSDRLLTAKSVADVALAHTSDKAAADKITQAVFFYVEARDNWKRKIDGETLENSVQESWDEGSRAVEFAAAYCRAPRAQRSAIEGRYREQEERIATARRVAIEQRRQAEQKLEKERLAAAEQERKERLAAAEQKRKEAKQAHSVIVTFSAAEGTRDSAQPRRLTLTDVAIEVPTSDDLGQFGSATSSPARNKSVISTSCHQLTVIRFCCVLTI